MLSTYQHPALLVKIMTNSLCFVVVIFTVVQLAMVDEDLCLLSAGKTEQILDYKLTTSKHLRRLRMLDQVKRESAERVNRVNRNAKTLLIITQRLELCVYAKENCKTDLLLL